MLVFIGHPPGSRCRTAASYRFVTASAPRRSKRIKPSFNKQRDLAALPAELESLKGEKAALLARMSAADDYSASGRQMKRDAEHAADINRLREEKLARCMALEGKAKATAEVLSVASRTRPHPVLHGTRPKADPQ